jgi:Ca-activated chloride channel homolog
MAGSGGGDEQKLGLAVEGASQVIELAHERDYIGLVTFSDTPKWVFKPLRANESNKLQMLAALSGVQPEGGTVLAPTYREAIAALKGNNAAVKHIILLTDGQLADDQSPFGGPLPDFAAIARAARNAGITTSSIAIGGDADVPRLKAIAEAGQGRFYNALDVNTLPRIFTTEALTATRGLVRLEPFVPTLARHPLAANLTGKPPTLTAYVATTLRPEAQPIIVGLDREPVLAVLQKGLGRSAALTADLNRPDGFTGWSQLPGLLGTVGRWLLVPNTPFVLSLSPSWQGGGQRVSVDAIDGGRYRDGERLAVQVAGMRIELAQTGPGRYQADLPAGASGALVLVRGGQALARAKLQPKQNELQNSGGSAKLAAIAAASGGQVLASLTSYSASQSQSQVPLAPWLALLAGLLLVAELGYRRWRL